MKKCRTKIYISLPISQSLIIDSIFFALKPDIKDLSYNSQIKVNIFKKNKNHEKILIIEVIDKDNDIATIRAIINSYFRLIQSAYNSINSFI
ncbi:MAG: KEOPS complex subunit Pcc1 [Nitrososphaeraceae archaeon]